MSQIEAGRDAFARVHQNVGKMSSPGCARTCTSLTSGRTREPVEGTLVHIWHNPAFHVGNSAAHIARLSFVASLTVVPVRHLPLSLLPSLTLPLHSLDMAKLVTYAELKEHRTKDSLYILLHEKGTSLCYLVPPE